MTLTFASVTGTVTIALEVYVPVNTEHRGRSLTAWEEAARRLTNPRGDTQHP